MATTTLLNTIDSIIKATGGALHTLGHKDLKDLAKDLGDGLFDTLVKAPYAIGDFIARASGMRDLQLGTGNYYRMQAKNEVNMILNALGNPETAKLVFKSLGKEFEERPLYFIAGIFGSRMINKLFDGATITTAKVDAKVHELLEKEGVKEVYDLLQKLGETGKFDIIGNSWDKILDFYGNFDDVVKYYSKTELSQIWDDTKDYFGAWKNLLAPYVDSISNDLYKTLQETKISTAN